jgi:hypothetical protein
MRVQNQPQQNRVVHEIIASDIPKDKKIAITLQAATLSNKKEPNHGFQIFLPTIWAAGLRRGVVSGPPIRQSQQAAA